MIKCLLTRERKVQQKAERIYEESGRRYGTPPGIPLISYDQMCSEKGIRDVSVATRKERKGKTKWNTKSNSH